MKHDSLFKMIAHLPRRYVQLAVLRFSFILILFALFIVLTLFAAFVMLTQWHWAPWLAFTVCFTPWLLVLVILFSMALCESRGIEQDKHDIFNLGREHLVSQTMTLLFAYLQGKKESLKKRKHKEEDGEE